MSQVGEGSGLTSKRREWQRRALSVNWPPVALCIFLGEKNQPPRGAHTNVQWSSTKQILSTLSVYRTHLCKCFQKVAQKRGDLPRKALQTNEPPLGCHHLLPSWLLRSQVWTPTQCIEHVLDEKEEICTKNRANKRFASKTAQTNEPPLGCHHLLPSWLLRSQVWTPTQCIEPVSVSVSRFAPKTAQTKDLPQKLRKRMSPL